MPVPANADAAKITIEPRVAALSRGYRLARVVVVVATMILAIWLVSGVLMVVFAAALLAVILHGVASLLQRYTGLPLWAALGIVVVVIIAVLVGLGFIAGPGLAEQATALRKALTMQAQNLQGRLSSTDWGRTILDQIPQSLGGLKDGGMPGVPTGFAGSVAGVLGSVVGVFGTLAVVVIAAIYLAAEPATYVNGALRLVVVKHRAEAKELFLAAGKALWAWSAGQALDMLVVGIVSGVGLWLIGVPLALVLGVVAGLSNFVPYIGAIFGAIPAVIIAFSVGASTGFETIALYLVLQAFEGNVMAPMIQNRAVHLPPGLTILSQTAFGAILGLPGLIFATPLTAALLAVAEKATPKLEPEDEI